MGQVADSIARAGEQTLRGFGMVGQALKESGEFKMQQVKFLADQEKTDKALALQDRQVTVQEGTLKVAQSAQELAKQKMYMEMLVKGEKGKAALVGANSDVAMTTLNGMYDSYHGFNAQLATKNKDMASIPILAPDEFTKMQKAYKESLIASLGEEGAATQLRAETDYGIQVMHDLQESLAKGGLQKAEPTAIIQKFETLKAKLPEISPVRNLSLIHI